MSAAFAASAGSRRQLAFEAGLHRTYFSGIERGIRNVGIDNIGVSPRHYRSNLSSS
jgi:hypothetical protein